jgi:proteasome lid subunit RPN8/RPN11
MPMPSLYAFCLHLPCRLYEEMMNHARREWPNECCGMIGGRRPMPASTTTPERVATAVKLYPLVNEAASPVEFRVSQHPSLFAAVRDMRQNDLDVVAVYHSHPTSDPVPSKKDCEQWYYDGSMCLIIGLAEGEPRLRGWWIDSEHCTEADWKLTEDPV